MVPSRGLISFKLLTSLKNTIIHIIPLSSFTDHNNKLLQTPINVHFGTFLFFYFYVPFSFLAKISLQSTIIMPACTSSLLYPTSTSRCHSLSTLDYDLIL